MLRIRNKDNLLQNVVRRIGYRHLARILSSWSLHAREARRGEMGEEEGGDREMMEMREIEGVGGEQLKVMEEWVKELTSSVDALKCENVVLRAQQRQQGQQGQMLAPRDELYTSHVPSAQMKECRSFFDSWRFGTSTARSERRGALLAYMDRWRESCNALCARQPTLRELELQAHIAQLQRQLEEEQAATCSEQETSEKFVFLLTDKETMLDSLRCQLVQVQEQLRLRLCADVSFFQLTHTRTAHILGISYIRVLMHVLCVCARRMVGSIARSSWRPRQKWCCSKSMWPRWQRRRWARGECMPRGSRR